MSDIVNLNGVELSYPVYSIRAQSLRNTIASLAVGGKLLKNGQDVVHVKALSNITFKLREGDRMGIIGHNGAGKTTLLKAIAGIYEPDRGLVQVKGRISSTIDIGLGLDMELTGAENITSMGRMRGYTTRQTQAKLPEISAFSDLGTYIDMPVKTYSAGMLTRLVFSVATSLEPDVLLMDEWLGAGDDGFIAKAKQRMTDILTKSRVMVLATHNFALIESTCNKLLVLNGGEQVYFGDVSGWDIGRGQPRIAVAV